MTLRELEIGKSAVISTVGGEGALRQHFLDMGMIPGAEVKVVKLAPMGDPMELEIHGYELTIRLADADKIEQVLQNLIDNAIKFTEKDNKIILSTYKENDRVLVCVKDQGAGISNEELKFIWDRFYTVDKAHSGKKSGTGLGLAIVKSIIELHEQEITVKSEINKGTEFIFTLEYAGE